MSYTLYLDESEIPITDNSEDLDSKLFVIGGVIIEDVYHNNELTNKLNVIKDKIWDKDKYKDERHGYVLHEMEVTYAKYGRVGRMKHKYHKIFMKPSKYKLLYEQLTNLINTGNFSIIASSINEQELFKIYNQNVINNRMSILMQVIIENYYHFLVENEATGSICYESMPTNQNEIIEKRYAYIRNTGTMYYPAKSINRRIHGLYFKDKDKNIAGLQIADFIPNTLGRVECDKDSNSKLYYESISKKLYDGNRNLSGKFGYKIIP